MNSLEKHQKIQQIFAENADASRSRQMAKYMRNQFNFFGIDAKSRKNLSKDFIKSEKQNQSIDWQFLQLCYADEQREMQYLVLDYLISMQKFLIFDDAKKLLAFIEQKPWWDSIDLLAPVVGSIGLQDSRLDNLMLSWSKANNFWVRRVAVLHQLKRKDKTNTPLLEQILINNFGSSEFFINKAIGWSLREFAKTNPNWVQNFIAKHGSKMSNLSIKQATKYL